MNPLQTLRIALRALLRNKTRSILTTLGIVIGVGAVIAMVAIGEGAKSRVADTFASMGTNLLVVLPGSSSAGGAQGGFGSQPTLTWDDLRAMKTEVPGVGAAAPQLRVTSQLLSDEQNWGTTVYGVTPEYFDVRAWQTAEGAAITQGDVDGGAKVVVLGETVVDKLFGANAHPVGQTVRIKNVPFVVSGVLARKGQSATGQDYDDCVYVPVTTFQTKIQGGLQKYLSGTVYVSAASADQTASVESGLRALLRERHHLAQGQDDDFSIRNLAEMQSAQAASTDTLTTLLAAVAGVSLLVGGIGIMNIMLVSVTERTREIGLRMAIGAKRTQILGQFLAEAMALAFLGGLMGVALGVGAAGELAHKFGWTMLVRPEVVLVAVGFSALTGVVFGLYPARKASRLDPIDALRFE
ncbi:MAG TPA: ABC transporter permease [Byssovorax sp.]|jgi:putative ABC transport system permease protein